MDVLLIPRARRVPIGQNFIAKYALGTLVYPTGCAARRDFENLPTLCLLATNPSSGSECAVRPPPVFCLEEQGALEELSNSHQTKCGDQNPPTINTAESTFYFAVADES